MYWKLLALGAGLVTTLSGCVSFNFGISSNNDNGNTANTTISDYFVTVDSSIVDDETLAYALLAPDDLLGIEGMEDAMPSLIELNSHSDAGIPGDYNFYVARVWYDRPSENMLITNTITQFNSEADAQTAIQAQAEGNTILDTVQSLGDTSIAYYQAADDDRAASVTYRFTWGVYSGKAQVFVTTDVDLPDEDLQAALAPIAEDLAQTQISRLSSLLSGNLIVPAAGTAMNRLPFELSNTTYIGSVPVSEQEWQAISYDFGSDGIAGFNSAGLTRFNITARPAEVVEVTVLEFTSPAAANDFQGSLVSDESSALELPTTLSDTAAGIKTDSLVEIQAVQDNYVIDVAVFAPIEEMDIDAATTDAIAFTEELLNNF